MGYSTEFEGTLKIKNRNDDNGIDDELKNYINRFAETRHMKLNEKKIKENVADWKEKCFRGMLGKECQYYLGPEDWTEWDTYAIDKNVPPDGVPGLWCQWIVNDNGELTWDGGEKFYKYTEWLKYLITEFFEPDGYILNGSIVWEGEDDTDCGTIIVANNFVTEKIGCRMY